MQLHALRIGHPGWMPIEIWRVETGFLAHVTPPHGNGVEWQSTTPMDAEALIDALRDRGCHQTDIGDAFHAADPEWLSDG